MAITTRFWTRGQIRTKIEEDLDLEEEDFVQYDEMSGYIEEAIDEAEKTVHTLYEDYYLKKLPLSLVDGTDEYDLPVDIYAEKIRGIIYKNGDRTYRVTRIKDWKKFEQYALQRINPPDSTTMELHYFLTNSVPGSPQILFTPVPTESGPYLTIWYLRQANRPEAESEIIDIPEGANFIIQYVKVRCYEKEGHPNLAKAMIDLDVMRTNLEATLTTMVPDSDNEIEMDLTFYEDQN